jgi:hypothetical protein
MRNHIRNKLTFDAKEAKRIFSHCLVDGNFDFNALIPQPLQIYNGNPNPKTEKDRKDFIFKRYKWNKENWGTGWNSYGCDPEIAGDKAFIRFDTADGFPHQIISAFANKFGIDFEYIYLDERNNLWGVEKWINSSRTEIRFLSDFDKDEKRTILTDFFWHRFRNKNRGVLYKW